MAEASTSSASDQNVDILELFADTDSVNGDFEGFDPLENDEDQDINDDWDYLFDVDNWEYRDRNPTVLEFTPVPGRNRHVCDNASVCDFFNLFVTNDDFEDMSLETNRYAEQYLEKHQNLPRNSRYRKWKNTTASELKRYIALIFAMGLISQSDSNEYWTTDPVTSTPFFPACMSRDRFILITSFFHLANNDDSVPYGQPGYNPLHKLGSFFFKNIRSI